MSLPTDQADEPRRGSRTRKQVDRFEPTHGSKNRHDGSGSDDSEEELSDSSGDYQRPTRKRKAKAPKASGSPVKRARKARKPKATQGDAPAPEPVLGFKNDSPLFNALLSPDVALQPLVEDWVHAYQGAAGDTDAEKAAVHELVLFFVRACGLSATIDEDEAMDEDGVASTVENIQDESVKINVAIYPLITRTKALRPFKANLTTVITHLVETLYLTPHLFETAETTKHSVPLMPLLFAWLHQMTSSPLRPIRHTATFMALKLNSALCEVTATTSNELSIKQRQREAEAKKKGGASKRKEADENVKEAHARKTTLEEYMQDNFDTVFVNRVRDADPIIRADCLHELGVWVKKFPEMYVSATYLNYFIRGSNDPDGHARLETVKALGGLFSKLTAANNVSTFMLRIAPRLMQMAALDIETPVRSHAVNVITQIDKSGALQDDDEEQRDKVARLVFDQEPRIRKAAASFVRGLWEERIEKLEGEWNGLRDAKKKRAGKVSSKEMERRFQWKALASLLVETSHALDEPSEEPSSSSQTAMVTTASAAPAVTRASAAAEALWSQIDLLQDWHALVDYLLLDHSTADNDMWLLTDEEEDFMLQMLVACIKREDKDKDDDEDEKTKALIKVLPRLFTKHHSEVGRIVGILSIPEYMNLSLYLDMRMAKAYETLWDDVTKQFLQHTDPKVLAAAIQAINTLNANTSMSDANSRKLAELEDSLFVSLRDFVDGEDVPAMTIDDDQVTAIESILLRISLLARSRNIVDAMEDEEGGQSSGWTIVSAFAGRGALGYKYEAKMVEHALQIIFLHVTWLFKNFTEADAENEAKVDALKTRRDEALELFERFGVRDRTNAAESVRRQAFIAFINMHILFSARGETPPPGAKACAVDMATDKQHKLGGAFQAAVDRYASDLDDDGDDDDDHEMNKAKAEREFIFLQLVAVFVGAIRCGVIDVAQSKEPLAHYGRFGPTYDQVAKKLVDVLRDEGIYNGESTTVQHVVGEALQNSFSIFLDGDNQEPEATISLARVAASAFVVHGTHFSVLKQIRSDDVCDLHMGAIDWVFKQAGVLVKQRQAKDTKEAKARVASKLAQLLTFFRPLALLLGPIGGRDALRIRAHLEQAAESSGAPIQTRGAAPYRAYEKRLVGIAGKDSGLKVAAARPPSKPKSAKSAAEVEDSDDEEREEREERAVSEPASEHGENADKQVDEEDANDEPQDHDAGPVSNGKRKRGEAEDAEDLEDLDDEGVDADAPDANASILPDLDLPDINMDAEIDLAFGDLPSRSRSRSVSVGPAPSMKKKKPRKF